MAKDPELLAHQEWLGYLQPVGLVVSAPALLQAQAYVNRNILPEHQRFLNWVQEGRPTPDAHPVAAVTDLPGLFCDVFGWEPGDLLGGPGAEPLPASLEVVLTDYQETLRPTYAARELPRPGADVQPLILLIQVLPTGTELDKFPAAAAAHHWQASPQARFERLLRETRVPIGLLVNGTHLRLVYAPRQESTGHVTFPVQAMTEVAGRPIFAALHMLLSVERVFQLDDSQRLPHILKKSRAYQNDVSDQLADQVLAALYELLRGFQAADDQAHGDLLRDVLAAAPDTVYAGLLTVLMRLVFLLYAEDRGLLPADRLFVNHYALTGLFDRLRADAGRYPDTMDQRYGAWAQLLTLFRLVHDGARHGTLVLPARHGYLFDPDRYPFLEGRPHRHRRDDARLRPPLVSDGVVFRVLHNLLIVDGEHLSYRHLEVEHIGSVYERMMGFRLERSAGRSVAVKPTKKHGAPVTINLEALLALPADRRAKWLKEQTEQTVTGPALAALKAARTPEDVVAALDRKVAKELTPAIVAGQAMILQPSAERRRSGAHYTPRSLTGPIVQTALRPVLERLGPKPKPQQILGLKVCDPAMGSGAFLVEACRQLGAALVAAWEHHGAMPKVPDDETPELFAQRMVAQRCLYGVDKNPMAVDLAKLSLWLVTLAKDHPFTFLDHALRPGDSLVGLSRDRIADFHWNPNPQLVFGQKHIEDRIKAALDARLRILGAGDFMSPIQKSQDLVTADNSLNLVRFAGNLVVAAFFAGTTDKQRKAYRDTLLAALTEYLAKGDLSLRPADREQALLHGPKPVQPFHWEIEFPEVFSRDNPGFDVIVGNPPFAGKNTVAEGNHERYPDWLKAVHEKSHGNADLVAHFFRRAFNLLCDGGAFGLIATNTIAQGDTRATGLRWICTNGGTIYAAKRRMKWPGEAAVVVSVIHVFKGPLKGPFLLDDKSVVLITAYLFHAGGHENPMPLIPNANKSFQGNIVLGMGFTFDDTDKDGVASPISLMHELIAKDKRNAERIFPYIGGEEVNDNPTHTAHRFIIDFEDMSEDQARQWPDLMRIVEEMVRPARLSDNRATYRKFWWQFAEKRSELRSILRGMQTILGIARVGNAFAFTFLPARQVLNDKIVVVPFDKSKYLAVLQSRVHEVWVRFQSSTLKDDLQYTPSLCFETFPFPEGVLECGAGFQPAGQVENLPHSRLEAVGKAYYEFRAALMVKNNEGLTKTYNRFHDPHERSADILGLRELHAAMDRAVLDAYGWQDLQPTWDFILDYVEEEEKNEGKGRSRKKPWRYRWPDAFRDEVLARLLELNRKRSGQKPSDAAATPAPKKARKGRAAKPADPQQPELEY